MTVTVANRTGPGPAQLTITGEITADTAREVGAELRLLHGRELEVVVNSRGGDYQGGMKIYERLRDHRGPVTTVVDGLAASAASLIFMGGDQRLVCPGARVMIHDPSLSIDLSGPAHQVERVAEVMAGMASRLAAAYYDRAGGTVQQWRTRMIAETWYDAQAAVDWRLATGFAEAREPVTATVGSRRIVYSPENRAERRSGALMSPFAGGWSDEEWSVLDPRWRQRTLQAVVMVASMSADRERREAVRAVAKRVDYHHAGYWLGYKHPLVQALARSN